MAETPIGVTAAAGQFDCADEMEPAPAVMEDLFKNLMICRASAHLIYLDWTLMKIAIGG